MKNSSYNCFKVSKNLKDDYLKVKLIVYEITNMKNVSSCAPWHNPGENQKFHQVHKFKWNKFTNRKSFTKHRQSNKNTSMNVATPTEETRKMN